MLKKENGKNEKEPLTMGTARTRANNKYNKKAYDRIHVTLPKGDKDKLKAAADARGISVNALIVAEIKKYLE